MGSKCGRRQFLKAAGAAAVGSAMPLGAIAGSAAPLAGTKVAIAVSSAHAGRRSDLDAACARRLVDESVRSITGAADAEGAWKTLFRPTDTVAVKINTLAGARLSTRPVVVDAVVAGLLTAGVRPEGIIVFDRSEREMRRAGFTPGDISGVRYRGTDSPDVGLSPRIIMSGEVGSLMSRVITEFATAIVNVPVLKDHDLSGVSLGMKNFFGVIHNPNKYHDNGCDPYIADLSSCPLIRDRLRLVVIDGCVAQFDGGPAFTEEGSHPYGGVIVGTDPVATDRVGSDEIEGLRKKAGLPSLEEVGRPARHIATAAKRGLGTDDLERIEVTRITV